MSPRKSKALSFSGDVIHEINVNPIRKKSLVEQFEIDEKEQEEDESDLGVGDLRSDKSPDLSPDSASHGVFVNFFFSISFACLGKWKALVRSHECWQNKTKFPHNRLYPDLSPSAVNTTRSEAIPRHFDEIDTSTRIRGSPTIIRQKLKEQGMKDGPPNPRIKKKKNSSPRTTTQKLKNSRTMGNLWAKQSRKRLLGAQSTKSVGLSYVFDD